MLVLINQTVLSHVLKENGKSLRKSLTELITIILQSASNDTNQSAAQDGIFPPPKKKIQQENP